MTQAARARRVNAVKTAAAINAIEGVPVSNYAKQLYASWARGELTGEQMKSALLLRHQKLAEQECEIQYRELDAPKEEMTEAPGMKLE